MNIPTCCSTKNQERVLLNLAIILFIQRAPTSCKMPFPISSPTTPSPLISGAFYLLTEMDLCATLLSQDSALMKSIFHLITVKLLDWRDQKSRSSTTVKFHRCFGYGMPRSLGLTVALPKEPLKPLDIRISNQRGCRWGRVTSTDTETILLVWQGAGTWQNWVALEDLLLCFRILQVMNNL